MRRAGKGWRELPGRKQYTNARSTRTVCLREWSRSVKRRRATSPSPGVRAEPGASASFFSSGRSCATTTTLATMAVHGARQGRQPAQKSKPASTKAKAGPAKGKGKGKASRPAASTSAAPLDVYSYSSSIKRPRGDVDPESRPQKAPVKGKGKARASDSEESDSDGDDELGGAKMDGLYLGGNGSDDGGVNSEDDEDIDSDEAFEDEEDLPAKPKKGKGKVSSFRSVQFQLGC